MTKQLAVAVTALVITLFTTTCSFAQEPEATQTVQAPPPPVSVGPKPTPKPVVPEPKTINSVVVIDGNICVQSVTTNFVSVTSEQIGGKIEELEKEILTREEKHRKDIADIREKIAELSKIVVQVQRQERKSQKGTKVKE